MQDIDVFEYFDSYSIFAALSLEASGIAERGSGWKKSKDDMPAAFATFGGLKARGHPGGATGVYQAVEACMQLRGSAGKCQVENAETALIQALGGPATTAISHVLKRLD